MGNFSSLVACACVEGSEIDYPDACPYYVSKELWDRPLPVTSQKKIPQANDDDGNNNRFENLTDTVADLSNVEDVIRKNERESDSDDEQFDRGAAVIASAAMDQRKYESRKRTFGKRRRF